MNPNEFETNLVIVDDRLFVKLAAFTRVVEELGWPWKALTVLRLLPRPLANWLYDRIALNRYRLFGKYDSCMLPSPEMQARIVDRGFD